jgi:exosome complex component RRP45
MAPAVSNYVSIRDDAGLKSLSRNERSFTRDCALRQPKPLRLDGRTAQQVRPVRLHLGRWDHGSECTVQWGNTRVTSLCTAELVRPNLDRPNEGQMVLSVDLSPSASASFRQAPPFSTGAGGPSNNNGPNHASNSQRLQANRIMRCLEKIVLTGGTLDVEALCVIPAQWVWRFHVAITVLDDGGNPMDAAVMAAIASLRHYRKPHVDMQGGAENDTTASTTPVLIPSHLKEPTPLPLHHTPLAISFAFIPLEDGHASATMSSTAGVVAAFLDPTDREELVQNASLTVGMNVHGEVCLLDYGGGCELPPTQMQECWKKAESCIRQLCEMLEKSLDDADQQAQTDRLQKLVLQQQQEPSMELPPLPSTTSSPYFHQSDTPFADDMNVDDGNDNTEQIQTKAEEDYRQFALDFTQGYKANKVREDDDRMKHSSQAYFNQAGKLMKSLVQSAKSASSSTPDDKPATDAAAAPPANVHDKKQSSKEANATKPVKTAAPAKKPAPQLTSEQLDSDEEETTQMLQSEFQSHPPPAPAAASTIMPIGDDDDDDDIDDLAMAISSKKKRKKKAKK